MKRVYELTWKGLGFICLAMMIGSFFIFNEAVMAKSVKTEDITIKEGEDSYLYFGTCQEKKVDLGDILSTNLKWKITKKTEKEMYIESVDSAYDIYGKYEDEANATNESIALWVWNKGRILLLSEEERGVCLGEFFANNGMSQEGKINGVIDLTKMNHFYEITANEYAGVIVRADSTFEIEEKAISSYAGGTFFLSYNHGIEKTNPTYINYAIYPDKKDIAFEDLIEKGTAKRITTAQGECEFAVPKSIKNGNYIVYVYTYSSAQKGNTMVLSDYTKGEVKLAVKNAYKGKQMSMPINTYMSATSVFVAHEENDVEFGIRKAGESKYKWQESYIFLGLSEDTTYEIAARKKETDTTVCGGESKPLLVCTNYWIYSVRYILNGGKNSRLNPITYQIVTPTLKLYAPTRKGYEFTGWYKEKSKVNKISKISKGSKGNLHLYAEWEKISVNQIKKVKISKVKKKKFTVSFKKLNKKPQYEISVSTNKKFKKKATKTYTVTKNSFTVKKCKKKTKYYVRIRGIRVDSTGEKIYGEHSTVKTVVTK